MKIVPIQPLSVESFSPYGWLLGRTLPPPGSAPADFWREHLFDPGAQGEVEILRVHYRNSDPTITRLEMHRLCQQVVIPLTGEITQIVAVSGVNGEPDLNTIAAFRVPVGAALCMRPACWHTTRVNAAEIHCFMLTRASTTVDLANHLNTGSPLVESVIAAADVRINREFLACEETP